jgi:hypothetical protein
MPFVVVGLGADMADSQGWSRRRPFERLALALFIAAEDQSLIRRIQVQTDQITSQNFRSNCGSLEILKVRRKCGFRSLSFQMRCTLWCDTPTAAMSPCSGCSISSSLRRLHQTRDDLPHLVRRKPSLASSARSVFQPIQPLHFKASRPGRHGGEAHTQRSGHVRLSDAFGAAKNNASPEAVSLAAGLTVSHALQVKFLSRGQFERAYGTGHKFRITGPHCYYKIFKSQDIGTSSL